MYLIPCFYCYMIHTDQDITPSLQAKIKTKINQCLEIAETHYSRTFYPPKLDFSLTGRHAGRACSSTNTIQINSTILIQNEADYINQTVPHEVAHLVTDAVYPHGHLDQTKKTATIPHHGTGWKHVMELFGVQPALYHNYAIAPSIRHNRVKYAHICSVCNNLVELSVNQSILARADPTAMYHLKCGTSSRLTPQDDGIVPLSKFGKCEQIYLTSRAASRADLIQLFAVRAGTTPASGATYYSKLRKKYDR
jgi:SprT protein